VNAGEIRLSPLRQADGLIKTRPVLLLRSAPPFGDFIACGLSTQLQQEVKGFDEIIGPDDADFSTARLRQPSLIRLAFLGSIPARNLHGKLGWISDSRLSRLLTKLADFFRPN